MGKSTDSGKKRIKRICLITLIVILTLVIVLCLVAAIYVNHMLNLIGRPPVQEPLSASEQAALLESPDETIPADFTGPTFSAEEVSVASEPAEIIKGENLVSILLVGQDRRASEGRGRSDATILCTFDKEKKTLTMTSFLRDMYVQIPGYFPHKINSSYALGGFKALDDTLEYNFGVQVDGNVEVDFYGFMDVIDLLDGVDIALTASEASYLNRHGNWDLEANGGWSLKEGMNHLNGSQALAYSRIRYLDSDFGRTNRQRVVLTALVDKCKGLSLLELNELLTQILPLISTDMSNSDILSCALELAPLLLECEIKTQQIPAEGTYIFSGINGMSTISVDLEANREILREILGQTTAE